MTWQEWSTPNGVTAVAAILAALGAFRGVNTWRAQLKGQHAYDVARRTYLAVLKVREGVATIRTPGVLDVEVVAAATQLRVGGGDASPPKVMKAVFRERAKPLKAALQELEVTALEAEVALSADIRALTLKMRQQVAQLAFAANHELDRQAKRNHEMTDFDEKQLLIHAQISPENDPYGEQLNATVEEFAEHLKTHLDRDRAAWWQFWRRRAS